MPPSLRRRLRAGASGMALAVAAATVGALPATPATAEPEPLEDHCAPFGCYDILSPGQNGNATLVEILGHQAFGTRPQNSSSQLDMYDDLGHHDDNLHDEQRHHSLLDYTRHDD